MVPAVLALIAQVLGLAFSVLGAVAAKRFPRSAWVGLAMAFLVMAVWQFSHNVAGEWRASGLKDQLTQQATTAAGLADRIPKECTDAIDPKPWNTEVERWRTETMKILAIMLPREGLDQVFGEDKGDYPHPCGRIEWVRNRLQYFRDALRAVQLALYKR